MLRLKQLREMAAVARNLASQTPDERTQIALWMEATILESKARRREVELGLRPPLMRKADKPQA